ncbi:MAG TPA: TIGR02444 family protein [Alphaproteobacteria bacterium]|nr:TIGR02444 family protein [Alphaproteobacteria bacterium]
MSEDKKLWDWMLEVYPRPGVSEGLIALQDRERLNVNALLFCIWLACRSGRLTIDLASEIERLDEEWANAIVAPIRTTRRLLKSSNLIPEDKKADVRKRIQGIELELEEMHCSLLEQRAAPDSADSESEPESRIELANDNLRQYFAARQMAAGDQERIIGGSEWQRVVKAISAD